MTRGTALGVVLALAATLWPGVAGAGCSSAKCPDALAVADLRARIAAECDCDAVATPKDWARCVKRITKAAGAEGTVAKACAKAVRRCEARTTCGKTDAAVCCLEKDERAVGRIMRRSRRCRGTVCTANPNAGDACRPDASCAPPPRRDPGTGPWEPVPLDRVAQECGLDPTLLQAADAAIRRPYAVVRYGKLCHEHYPAGTTADDVDETFSVTKTLGALVTGVAAYRTRDLPRIGRKTGPIRYDDRVDHWLDAFTFNPDARIGHVLGMIAQSPDLAYGARSFEYDADGTVQINRLSDVIETAIRQDPARFGQNLEEFSQRFLFQPLGATTGNWDAGRPHKAFGIGWRATVREMARLGLLVLNDGVWNGERLVGAEWIYGMTHPSFEDANRGYGYLTWLASDADGGISTCGPPAVYRTFPHGLSEAPDCNFTPPATCAVDYDAGVWAALGSGGQVIIGHPGLDLVLVAKDLGLRQDVLWQAVRHALVMRDPRFVGDEAAFCAQYDAGSYAPDLR